MRLPEPRWDIRRAPAATSDTDVAALARRLGVPPLVASLLCLRGWRDEETAQRFLQPRLEDLTPPWGLPDAARAADRIAHAVRSGERIAVCGDYDVDGMTGTALLVRFLGLLGADVTWSIPDRDGDGYGLSPAAIARLARDRVRVAVTVDNGIAAHEAIDAANAAGIDVVITDHHLPGATLPAAYAIVNPHLAESDGTAPPCGCTLAFKMAWAVAERLRAPMDEAKRTAVREALRDAVALAALATVADVMPLVGENRVIVSSGLSALRGSRNPGIRALLEVARLGAAPLTTEDVAFRIAPRINAAGRLSRPDLVVRMLTCSDEAEARALARSLDQANEERRRIERAVLAEATSEAHRRMDGGNRHSLVVHGQGWHRGVIGIVAARLLDRHHRPVAVIGLDGDVGRGSCRSIPNVDLHRALTECGAHLVRYGGHAMAAGFDIERGSLDRFCDAFEEAVRTQTNGTTSERSLTLDGECEIDALNLDALTALLRLAPFGPGNPEPVLLVRGASVAGRAQLMGETRGHLSFALKQTGGAIRVIGFRRSDLWDLVTSGKPLDVAVSPAVDEWRGVRTPELRLVGARPASGVRTKTES